MRWLPDTSGMLFVETDAFYGSANIVRHHLAPQVTTPLTFHENEVVRAFAVSPDGQKVALDHAPSLFGQDERGDLYVLNPDDSNLRRLVTDGQTLS